MKRKKHAKIARGAQSVDVAGKPPLVIVWEGPIRIAPPEQYYIFQSMPDGQPSRMVTDGWVKVEQPGVE